VSPRWIRRIVLVVFVAGVAGMIVSSVAERTGAAMTFGLLTAAAAVGLILVTSVAPPGAFAPPAVDDDAAAAVEAQVEALVADGANEGEVRRLVRRAVRLGRSMR
jgi:Na+/H+-dicarboxylate symporter